MIHNLTPETFPRFCELVCALADYEKLERPSSEAFARLLTDAFSQPRRFWAFLALDERSQEYMGYAICFESYSSFLAKPTMYLEDLLFFRNTEILEQEMPFLSMFVTWVWKGAAAEWNGKF